MNERIEQLALECYHSPEFDYKKFAELIVREFSKQVQFEGRFFARFFYIVRIDPSWSK